MTLRRRRMYFFLLVAVFFIAAPAVILYSQGYTLDLNNFSLKKTGAIFLSTSPKGVRIFVDNLLAASTSDIIFSQGKLLSHMAPKEYDVRIEKEAYSPWDKKLEVKPQLVTEARNIFLVPQRPLPLTIEKKVSDVIISDSNAMIAYVKTDGAAIFDVSSPKIIPLAAQPGEKVGNVRFGADENYLVVESFLNNRVRKYLLNVASGETTQISEDNNEQFIKIRQYPAGEPKIIALSSNRELYFMDTRSQQEKTTIATNISNFELFGDKILYATVAPTVFYEKDLVSGKTEQLNQTPVVQFDFSSKILRSRGGFVAFIDNEQSLFIYNQEEKIFHLIAKNVLSAIFSDDDKKLMWQNKNEIYIYYLKDIVIHPQKAAGEIELITRFSKPVGAIAWFSYDNEHILFAADEKLKLIELDGRDKRNVYDIAEVKKPVKIIYNDFDDFIYFLDGQTFKKITLIKN
ncbi:hypothetical protein HYR65_04005 [Candidatus Azambacteria bacterium]|nr:hypothetical protein [Candidatus Azambacteria bacterium]